MSKNTASLYDTDSFKWSKEEFSLSDLVSKFSHRIPFAFIVTQGYSGKEDVGADEMYWLHELVPQLRVVARDTNGDYLSIPQCYSEKVIPIASRGQDSEDPLMTLEAMIQKTCCSNFQFEPGTRHTIVQDTTELGVTELAPMEVINTYEEKFLAVHSLLAAPALEPVDMYSARSHRYIQEGVHPRFNLLPMYLPIGVAIALDVTNDEPETFQRTMYNFHTYVSSQPHDYRKSLNDAAEIMAYDQDPSEDDDYEYVHFRHFIKPKVPSQKPSPPSRSQIPDQAQHPGEWVPPVPPKSALGAQFGNQKGVHHLLKNASSSCSSMPGRPSHRTCESQNSSEDSDSDYETIPDDKPYHNAIQTQLANRVGPLAMDLDPGSVLKDLHMLLKSGSVPASNTKSEKAIPTEPDDSKELPTITPTSQSPTQIDTPQSLSNLDEAVPHTTVTQNVKKSTLRRAQSDKEQVQLFVPENDHNIASGQHSAATGNETSQYFWQIPSPPIITPTRPSGQQASLSAITPPTTVTQPCETPSLSVTTDISETTQEKSSDQMQGTGQYKPSVLLNDVTDPSQIPLNISDFTVGDVARSLELLHMSGSIDLFVDQQIDGDYLRELDEHFLQEELGLPPLHAKKLARFAKGWRPKF